MGTPYGYSLDYLSQVLSQRGPQAVPYAENVKWNIREHLTELQKVFPSLAVKQSEFHSNEGRLLHLLKAEGTIPIHFQGVKYNIPIEMWLLDRYPYQAPWVLVVPTQNMVVKQGHAFVDRSGTVSTPYIRNWLFPRCNLVELTVELSHVFGNDPPLYSQPVNYQPPPRPVYSAAYTSSGYNPGPGPVSEVGAYNSAPASAYGGQSGGAWPPASYPTYANPAQAAAVGSAQSSGSWQQPSGYTTYAPPGANAATASQTSHAASASYAGQPQQFTEPPPVNPKPELERLFREKAVAALEMQMTAVLEKYNKFAADETNDLLEVQRILTEREREIKLQVQALQQERMGFEGSVTELGSKTTELTNWLERNEHKVPPPGEDVPAAEAIVPADPLSKQGLTASAQDLALEDAIIALDKALQTGVIALDVYLKQVRMLCRRQFLARALSNKVTTAQAMQTTPAPVVQRPPPQQDGWHTGGMLSNPLASR